MIRWSQRLILMREYVHMSDAEAKAGDDALDVGWFTETEIRAQEFGRVTEGVLGVVKRAETLYEAGLLEPAE
jgi:hypothetical protein